MQLCEGSAKQHAAYENAVDLPIADDKAVKKMLIDPPHSVPRYCTTFADGRFGAMHSRGVDRPASPLT